MIDCFLSLFCFQNLPKKKRKKRKCKQTKLLQNLWWHHALYVKLEHGLSHNAACLHLAQKSFRTQDSPYQNRHKAAISLSLAVESTNNLSFAVTHSSRNCSGAHWLPSPSSHTNSRHNAHKEEAASAGAALQQHPVGSTRKAAISHIRTTGSAWCWGAVLPSF